MVGFISIRFWATDSNAFRIGHGNAAGHEGEGDQTLKDMGKRQEGQVGVLVAEGDDPARGLDVAREIGVAENDSLGMPSARSVDERRRITGSDRAGRRLEDGDRGRISWPLALIRSKDRTSCAGSASKDAKWTTLERSFFMARVFSQSFRSETITTLASRVVDDVFDLFRHERCIDGDRDGAQAQDGIVVIVHQGPFSAAG